MLFQDEDSSLKLEIVNYELPDGEGTPGSDDRNWLTLRATWVRDGEISKDSNSCLLTYELQEMTAGLKVLHAGIRDRYESDFTEPYFSLSAWTDESAEPEAPAWRFDVSFYLPNTMDGDDTAEVSCTMDRGQMKALLEELDRLRARFPDRN